MGGDRLGPAGRTGAAPRPRGPLLGRLHGLGSGIVFTRTWEDCEVDRRGLAIVPGARALVIASAGDKALNAALRGAAEVIAVDTNPSQLHLVALRLAALRGADDATIGALFGEGRVADPRRLYAAALRPHLDGAGRRYWDRRIDIFASGLHRHNRLGLAIAGFGRLVRLVAGRGFVPAIMAVPDAAAQGRLYERRYRRRFWNPLTRRLFGATVLLRSIALDPQERRAMQRERFLEELERRVSRLAATVLVRENPYWLPALTGRGVSPEHETDWLRPANLAAVRAAAGRVRLVHGSVVDALAAGEPGSLDAIDLSNVPDWLPAGELDRLWAALARALSPGGRALVRSALRAAPLPSGEAAAGRLIRDDALSGELTAAERTGLYATVSVLRAVEVHAP